MSVWQRILRYLILWGVLLAVLCVISVIRYWPQLSNIAANTFEQGMFDLFGVGLLVGLFVWGFRLLFRALR